MKRVYAFILVCILTAACLAGCSPKPSSQSPPPSPTSSPSGGSGSSNSSQESGSSGSSKGESESSEDSKKGNITAGGSYALQPLLTQAVGTFKSDKEFEGVITIDGGGSLQGLSDVMEGKVDIGNSDVAPEQLGMDGTGLTDHQIAIVAIAIVVSPDVAENLEDISTADLKGIFTGKITDWKQVTGWKGESLPVTGYYFKAGSGIRYLFDTYAINISQTDEELEAIKSLSPAESPAELCKALESGKGAIAYTAYPYCSKLDKLKLEGVEASYENVYTGKYKIWGCEHMYTKGEPTGAVKEFIDFLTSDDFKETITKSGYGVISEMKVSR